MTKKSDKVLLKRLRDGDERAFDEIYDAFRPRLFSFLARLTGRPALAEDLLQETFLKLAGHAPRLREDTAVGAWLFTVARNLFISHRRWAVMDGGRLSELRIWSALRGPMPTPFTLAAGSETEAALEAAVAALALPYREVILLTAVEGMSPSEAAGVIGATPEAVRKRLSRARDMLKHILENR